jgi:hypothetical protein
MATSQPKLSCYEISFDAVAAIGRVEADTIIWTKRRIRRDQWWGVRICRGRRWFLGCRNVVGGQAIVMSNKRK